MPNFTARMSLGGAVVPWVDPVGPMSQPSRINPTPSHPHRYLKASPGAALEFRAAVGGVDAPMDAALGGKLFQAWWAEWSGPWPPAIVQAAAQSSLVTVQLSAQHFGHFLLVFWRDTGGAVGIPFDVES